MKYKQFQKEDQRELHIAYWQLTTQLSFYEQQELSEHHKTWFHHILCNNHRGALYTGGLARLFGVWDFCWEKIFWGSSKILIWTIVRG